MKQTDISSNKKEASGNLRGLLFGNVPPLQLNDKLIVPIAQAPEPLHWA
ncbi:hypothetical protein QUA69_22275 [Microcoleus sp. LAD1_D1]